MEIDEARSHVFKQLEAAGKTINFGADYRIIINDCLTVLEEEKAGSFASVSKRCFRLYTFIEYSKTN